MQLSSELTLRCLTILPDLALCALKAVAIRLGSMPSTLPVLLYLGLSLGQSIQRIAGTPKKPILWAEPGYLIPMMGSVTLWCEGTLEANMYRFYTERSSKNYDKLATVYLRNKAKLTILLVTQQHGDLYHCTYKSSAGWSPASDPLELVVTGVYRKPRLSALPSLVVTLGESCTLHCASQQSHGSFILVQGEDQKFSRTLSYIPHRRFQATFSLGPITLSHMGTYRCYTFERNTPQVWSTPSDPLKILVSGMSKKPSLLNHKGSVLSPGETLTLQCVSDIKYGRFIVVKDGEHELCQHLDKKTQAVASQADFSLGPVNSSHGGRYRCYGAHNRSSELSAPSNPLDILITGQLPITPSLSVQPDSTVSSGRNVTLLCQSQSQVDFFLLVKEGAAQSLLCLKSKVQAGQLQAEFPISAVTADTAGTYRCYGYEGSAPYLLSHVSDPLYLVVSDVAGVQGLGKYQKFLIACSMSFLIPIVLLLLLQCWQQCKHRKAGLSSAATSPESSSCQQVRPEAEVPQEALYALEIVSRKRAKEASYSPFHLEQCHDMKIRPSGEVGQKDNQDVTYAQLNISKARQTSSTPPSSWDEESPAMSTVFTALITHQNRTSPRPQIVKDATSGPEE